MHRYFLLILFAGLTLTACRTPQTLKDAWKGTRSYYYEYLNTPAVLDLDDKGDILSYQAELGEAIAAFDLQLQELERVLQNSDRRPDAEWVASMSKRFPWLSGVALTDDEGIPRAKVPVDFPKPFEIGNLIEEDPKQQLKDLRAFVQMNDLGPEIYLGNPVYIGSEFRGVITVHFDPRGLLARTGDPAKVVIASPEGVLWPGVYDSAAIPLSGVEWREILKDRYAGLLSNELGTFYWVSRYLGNLPLIYAVKIDGDFPLNENNLQGLVQANSFALGPISSLDLVPQTSGDAEEGDQISEKLLDVPAEITPDGENSPLAAPQTDSPASAQSASPLVE